VRATNIQKTGIKVYGLDKNIHVKKKTLERNWCLN